MATIYYPDGRVVETQPKNGHDFKLEELQDIVGGSIEIIPTRDGRIMVINEEGKLEGLPRNEQATALVDFPSAEKMQQLLDEHPEVIFIGDLEEPDSIAGIALLCDDHEVQ